MSIWARTKYKTTNWLSYYNDSLRQRVLLSIRFAPEMSWVPPPSGKRGQQQQFSDAAIQTCLMMKVMFAMVVIDRVIGPSENGDAANHGFR